MSSKIEPSIGKENLEPRIIIEETTVQSIQDLITSVKEDYQKWNTTKFPWFRGEKADTDHPLLPKLYRIENNQKPHDENLLLQNFRKKAPSLGLMNTPPRGHTDEWLFLAQHVGLPTRLLDWTESLFVALFFALKEAQPVIWMLDPVELNNKSVENPITNNEFGLTWFNPLNIPLSKIEFIRTISYLYNTSIPEEEKRKILEQSSVLHQGISNANIRGAWENDGPSTELPVAIHPTYIHEMMHTQKSRFTIHGKKKQSISELVDSRVLRKYIIPANYRESINADLRMIGFTNTSVYPDLDNLAKELSDIY